VTMRYGFLDKTGSLAIPCKFVSAEPFSEGLSAVSEGGAVGFIDTAGNYVISPAYTAAKAMSGGLAAVYTGGKWGFVDKTGRMVVQAQYKFAESFSEGYAAVATDAGWQFINTSGRRAFSGNYDYATDFSGGYAAVMTGGKWGYINKSGAFVIPAIYDMARPFSEERACVAIGKAEGFIDREGVLVIPAQTGWTYQSPFSEGLALVMDTATEKLGFINRAGDVTLSFQYEAATVFQEEHAVVCQSGRWKVIKNPVAAGASSWAKADVAEAIGCGLVPQALQGNYTRQITRAEFCALAVRLIEGETGKTLPVATTFVDTADPNVLKLASLGIVEGIGGGQFNPSGSITREQAAKLLAGTAAHLGLPAKTGGAAFADAGQIAPWATGYVDFVSAHGIMTGVDGGRFAPKGTYTVEQSIVTMLRLYKRV
ncbi:WG repeat-containing protein, partial [Oscillospiraceae bacterium OttesenSCG-928-F05]|nr:WG repeat-containing protein [Oscillospiraceae bacterium OttesenSCG-928-F05]